jgi:hypothetical protein
MFGLAALSNVPRCLIWLHSKSSLSRVSLIFGWLLCHVYPPVWFGAFPSLLCHVYTCLMFGWLLCQMYPDVWFSLHAKSALSHVPWYLVWLHPKSALSHVPPDAWFGSRLISRNLESLRNAALAGPWRGAIRVLFRKEKDARTRKKYLQGFLFVVRKRGQKD